MCECVWGAARGGVGEVEGPARGRVGGKVKETSQGKGGMWGQSGQQCVTCITGKMGHGGFWAEVCLALLRGTKLQGGMRAVQTCHPMAKPSPGAFVMRAQSLLFYKVLPINVFRTNKSETKKKKGKENSRNSSPYRFFSPLVPGQSAFFFPPFKSLLMFVLYKITRVCHVIVLRRNNEKYF